MAWMLSFASGVAALWLLPELLTLSSFALAASLLVPWVGLWLCWPRLSNRHEAPPYRRAAVCALAVLAGFSYAHWHAATAMAHLLPANYDGEEFIVQGRVRGLVTRQALRRYDGSAATLQRFEFDVAAIRPQAVELAGLPQAWPRRLRLSSYREQQFTSGEYRHLSVRLRSPRGLANPGGFDLRRFMLARQLDGYGYVRAEIAGEPVLAAVAPGHKLQQMRVERYRALQAAFAQTRHPQIYNALLLGDKSGLSQSVRTLLNRTGTAHLLAISGLHIGLAAGLGLGFGYALLRCFPRLVLHLPSASVLALCCLPPAAFYAVLAGLAVPTQRALIMLGSFAVATLWQRNVQRFNHWCLAMFCVLLWKPLTILDSGFWLSFFAVAILLYCFAKDAHCHALQSVRAVNYATKHEDKHATNHESRHSTN
ncbi:MAG: ComEC family competence protein, partial [Gammaproteobacteria bacterium]|nr:ComEC family competence protein [Gammaproteobacteria bacterium]